jgi:hypothetical protein
MKKITVGIFRAIAALTLSAAAHAAPINYRFDPVLHLEMLNLGSGSSTIIGVDGPMIPASTAFSVSFTYDPDVALTPLPELPPNVPGVVYVDGFLAPGAFTRIKVSLGDKHSLLEHVSSSGLSYLQADAAPTLYHHVGAVGEPTGELAGLHGVFDGHSFVLSAEVEAPQPFAGTAGIRWR